MSLLYVADSAYIGVLDVAAACSWYIDKLGLQQVVMSLEEGEGVSLAFSKKESAALVLGPRHGPSDEAAPMLYATNIEKARAFLCSRSVSVGAIEKDRQGTRYFVMKDLDGNQIEISEEP